MKLNAKTVRWAVLLYIILVIPIALFHEFGHALVCAANGYTYRIWVDLTGGHEECSAAGVTQLLSYNVMGGIFGLIAGGLIIALGMAANRQPALLAVGLAYAVDQFMKIILEGFFTRGYLFHRFDLLITVVQVLSWIGFMLYFARVPEPPKISANANA